MRIAFLLFIMALPVQAAEGDAKALKLAEAVFNANGGNAWPRVKAIKFTFNVEQGEQKLLVAKHDWNVRANTDTVSWGGKTVTVNLKDPGADADAKAAYARWVNDSYWLLMPIKLKDPGVKLAYKGQQTIEKKAYEVLNLSFAGGGLTPGDQYNIYIDPVTHLVMRWDYMPNPEKKVSGTWDGYNRFGGLRLATEHKFGDKMIWLTEIVVTK